MFMNLLGYNPATHRVLVQQHWTFVNLEAYINWSTFQLDLMQLKSYCV